MAAVAYCFAWFWMLMPHAARTRSLSCMQLSCCPLSASCAASTSVAAACALVTSAQCFSCSATQTLDDVPEILLRLLLGVSIHSMLYQVASWVSWDTLHTSLS